MNQTGIDEMIKEDIVDLAHHCHSDLESDGDDDPFFEYNTCHKQSKLELKDLTKEEC